MTIGISSLTIINTPISSRFSIISIAASSSRGDGATIRNDATMMVSETEQIEMLCQVFFLFLLEYSKIHCLLFLLTCVWLYSVPVLVPFIVLL